MDSLPRSIESKDAADPLWSILVLADEAYTLDSLRGLLPGQHVRIKGSLIPSEALGFLESEVFHAIVVSSGDISPEVKGFLKRAMELDENTPVFLLIRKRDQISHLHGIIRPMTWTILTMPHPVDHMQVLLKAALERMRLQRELFYLRHKESYIHSFRDIVGNSRHLKEVLRLVARVAPSDATVLIHGESGTGKELIAAAIHYNSPRKHGPFVVVNCATLHENLLESELFGHEKGAFTGADSRRIGRFEQANGGTLFLDEVGDMSPKVQAKLLRVIQERSFERVGGSKTIQVNVRLIAATNQDLKDAIRKKRFRQDLYYRLNVMLIRLLPLRERPDDIKPLAEFFLKKYRSKDSGAPLGFHPEAMKLLQSYHWPGNVRELENVVERACLICQDLWIKPEDLMLPLEHETSLTAHDIRLPPGGVRLADVERTLIVQALERTQWIQKKAAKLLGISPRALHYKIRKHGIPLPRKGGEEAAANQAGLSCRGSQSRVSEA
jgi:DNA-binding NtrC family response regulator